MPNCQNCGKALNCGCKQRVAADGKKCCVTCIKSYESKSPVQSIPPVNIQKVVSKGVRKDLVEILNVSIN